MSYQAIRRCIARYIRLTSQYLWRQEPWERYIDPSISVPRVAVQVPPSPSILEQFVIFDTLSGQLSEKHSTDDKYTYWLTDGRQWMTGTTRVSWYSIVQRTYRAQFPALKNNWIHRPSSNIAQRTRVSSDGIRRVFTIDRMANILSIQKYMRPDSAMLDPDKLRRWPIYWPLQLRNMSCIILAQARILSAWSGPLP